MGPKSLPDPRWFRVRNALCVAARSLGDPMLCPGWAEPAPRQGARTAHPSSSRLPPRRGARTAPAPAVPRLTARSPLSAAPLTVRPMTLQGDRQRRDCPPVGHPFDLSGRVAVVTGGSSGIGAGIAAGLARAGTDVSIWGRDDARSAAVADELSAHGHWALAVHCGVTVPVDSRRRLRQLLIKPRENHGFE